MLMRTIFRSSWAPATIGGGELRPKRSLTLAVTIKVVVLASPMTYRLCFFIHLQTHTKRSQRR